MSPKPPSIADLQTTARPEHPYPGLRPFDVDEWSIFFGREQMIDDVIDRLATHHLVLIHGSSGSGKSSLVRAGVLPTLARQHRRARAPWLTCSIRPSGGPLWNLAKAFAQMEGRADDVARIDEIVLEFNRRNATLLSVFGSLNNVQGRRLCILVDQFEELFRFEKETSREEAELFIDLLVRSNSGDDKASEIAANSSNTKDEVDQPVAVHIVVTMRSEYLGECARFRGLAEAINRTQYLVPGMDRDALMRAIRRPAMLYGGEVSLELAEKLITEAAGREDELPLIQHGLMYLWNAAVAKPKSGEKIVLNGASLEQAGGLVNLLSSHADATVDEAASDQERRDAVERLFRALTDLNIEGKAIRRPQSFRDLVAVTEVAPDKLRAIIDVLRRDGVSFLTPYSKQPIADNTPIDISHEALIRCWNKLADQKDGWLKREFDDGLIWRSLILEARGFEKNKRRLLSPATTEERWKWWQERHLNAAWSARYGGSFPLVKKLIDTSLRSSRRRRVLRYGFVAALLVISSGVIANVIYTAGDYLRMRLEMLSGQSALTTTVERALTPKQVFQECAKCPVMVVVPAGDFEMGSSEKIVTATSVEKYRYENEYPQHKVTIANPFAVSASEVTFEQWDVCVVLGGCNPAGDLMWGRGNRPVINVTWDDAKKYVVWLSKWTGRTYRLLSESEWEYAARGQTTAAAERTIYSFGNDPAQLAKYGWYRANSNGQTQDVKTRDPNPFGLYDMHGNVWEWVEDCYVNNYDGAPADGSARLSTDCENRILRGGSWFDPVRRNDLPWILRSGFRLSFSQRSSNNSIGFRVARTLGP